MKVTTILTAAACLAGSFSLYADPAADREEAASSTGAYSVAGALRLPENTTKRDVYGMNVGWKLFKGKNAPEGVQRLLQLPGAGVVPEDVHGPGEAERQEEYPVF